MKLLYDYIYMPFPSRNMSNQDRVKNCDTPTIDDDNTKWGNISLLKAFSHTLNDLSLPVFVHRI